MDITPETIYDATKVFKSFCEDRLPDNHPFQKAWDKVDDILIGDPVFDLVFWAIAYGIENGKKH